MYINSIDLVILNFKVNLHLIIISGSHFNHLRTYSYAAICDYDINTLHDIRNFQGGFIHWEVSLEIRKERKNTT